MKKETKYFLVACFILALLTLFLSCCKTTYPKPRYMDEIKYHQRLQEKGYVEVTYCNLLNGEQKTIIKKQ